MQLSDVADEQGSSNPDSGLSSALETVIRRLESSLGEGDLSSFYSTFRSTPLPFLPVDLKDDPLGLFLQTKEVVWRLAGVSPAVALAVENHYSVLCPMATLPAQDLRLDEQRLRLLEQVQAGRWLIANTSSRVHEDQIAKTGTVVKQDGEMFEINGKATYLSLALEGDIILFITFFKSGEPALFVCPLKDNPAIEIGPLLFPNVMEDSDTRSVSFHQLRLDASHLLLSGREHPQILAVITYQIIWHQVLLAALAMGTAARALEEGHFFLRSVQRPDGTLLAELDGMIVDFGRQILRYRVAEGSLDQAGFALAQLASQPLEAKALSRVFELACAAKYETTHFAEEVVGEIRRLIGARMFTGGHVMERLSREVVFGQLGGEINAVIERRVGKCALREEAMDLEFDLGPERP